MPAFETSDGLRLHYTDEGAGTPLLCLSGLTRTGRDFDYMAPHLKGVRLIRMDYRGRGRSDWAGDFTSYNPVREAVDALELLDHLGLERAAVLGSSRGGIVAMMMAAKARDRLTGVAFNDIGPEAEMAGLEVIRGYLGRNPDWTSHDEAIAARAAAMDGFRGVPEARWREEVEKHYEETPEGLKITYDPKLRDATMPAFDGDPVDLWPTFDLLKGLPLAVIRGETSDLLSRATVEKMRDRHPDAITVEVADRGHIPFLDEPEALDALRRWLDRIP